MLNECSVSRLAHLARQTTHRSHGMLLVSLLCSTAAMAQQTSDDEQLETITVSASRITIAGYDQPTPVSVLGIEQLQTDAKLDIADAIRQLPALGASSSPNNQYNSNLIGSGVAGLDLVSLRNLGVNRTLVLFDGQRVISSNIRGGVDLSTLPSSLVERVDVVTGGASAAWGSDAVAGVVNLILNKKFDGVQVNLEDSDRFDGGHPGRKLEASFGTDFGGGRGHVIVSGSVLDSPNVFWGNQVDGYAGQRLIDNPACSSGSCPAGQPRLLHSNNVGVYGYTQGGVIVDGPAGFNNIEFVGHGATPVPYVVDTVSGGVLATGPSADLSHGDVNPLALPSRSYTGFGYASYDLTDTIKASVQLNYGQAHLLNDTYQYYTQATIQPNNAFWQQILTANPALAAQYAAVGSPAFSLGTLNFNNLTAPIKSMDDLASTVGGTVNSNFRKLKRMVFTLEGSLGDDWKWNAYYQHGESKSELQLLNNVTKSLFKNAVNAVYVTSANVGTSGLPIGSIACASPSDGTLIPNCAPLNLFGIGNASSAAINYIQGPARSGQDEQSTVLREDVVAAEAQGLLPFGLPAGRVATAFGVSYRSESGTQTASDMAAQRPTNFPYGNFSNFHGKYHVQEGYLEVNAPLLKDQLLESLNANAAVRVTDYSTSGRVETWKLGLTGKINRDVAFRGTYSRDIRAPNLQELFSTGTLLAAGNVIDPHTGQLATGEVFNLVGGGNLKLVPEEGRTLTAGVVLTPRWADNLAISLDWYKIDIKKAIDNFNTNQIIAECIAGNAAFCSSLEYGGPGGSLSLVNAGFINGSEDSTSGVDLAADYRTEVLSGNLLLHVAGNYTFEEKFSALGSTTDFAGSVGFDSNWPGFAQGVPKLKVTASATYAQGPWSGTIQGRFIGSAKLNNDWVDGVDVDNNNVPSVTYLDLRLSYQLKNYSIYAALDNVTNRYPPIIPQSAATGDVAYVTPVRDDVYDSFGRVYRVGLRARF